VTGILATIGSPYGMSSPPIVLSVSLQGMKISGAVKVLWSQAQRLSYVFLKLGLITSMITALPVKNLTIAVHYQVFRDAPIRTGT